MYNKQYKILVIFLSIFLNHSSLYFGINVSIADIFLLLLLFHIFLKDELIIDLRSMIYFLIVMIAANIGTYLTNIKFDFDVSLISFITNCIKLLTNYLYFILGYNIAKKRLIKISLKFFSISAFAISIIGLILNFLNVGFLKKIFFYASVRYRGLMIDPNYYSILLIISYVIILNFLIKKRIGLIKILAYIGITMLTIFMTGSKTGLLTFSLYNFVYLYIELFRKKKYLLTLLISLGLILIYKSKSIIQLFSNFLTFLNIYFPIINRISILFTDPSFALNSGGSLRTELFSRSLEIITLSPLFGVGIGTYKDLSMSLYNSSSVAHNTYLQLFSEWGLPLALTFFVYVFYVVINLIKNRSNINFRIVGYSLMILLVGSLSLSLNNARIFWYLFGIGHALIVSKSASI